MLATINKEELVQQIVEASKELTQFSTGITNELFFYPPVDKWSIAQNITHLTIAAKNTIPAFKLPKFIIRLYVGKPNRPSRTYDELVAKYKLKLEQGGRAGGRFIPKSILPSIGKEKILSDFAKAMYHLSATIKAKWGDPQLDEYIAPHPLLGKITHRELCYFTIYHIWHHLAIIKERLKENI